MSTKKIEVETVKNQQEVGNQEVTDRATWDFFAERIENKQREINDHIFSV